MDYSYYDSLAETIADEEIQMGRTYPINIHNITHDDMKNGDGLRVVLWVAGCNHHCKECHNPITWDENGGIPFTDWEKAELMEWLSKDWTQGITFSGGDPLHPANRKYIGELMEEIKTKMPEKDIWLYTGYRLEYKDGFVFTGIADSFSYEPLKYIDVLVDGRFECETRKNDIEQGKKVLWRGSSNQRIIDIPATIKNKTIIEKGETM